jgi:hypothetical protein
MVALLPDFSSILVETHQKHMGSSFNKFVETCKLFACFYM